MCGDINHNDGDHAYVSKVSSSEASICNCTIIKEDLVMFKSYT